MEAPPVNLFNRILKISRNRQARSVVPEPFQAAEQGDAKSQVDLATAYLVGNSVRQDYAEALKWCRKSADQGNADAQTLLGSMYAKGDGVLQNHAEAAKWFRKAADQGNADAQLNLGIMYFRGYGISQNYIQAHIWLSLSAAGSEGEGHKKAIMGLDMLEKKMTPQQIAEAQRLAKEARETSTSFDSKISRGRKMHEFTCQKCKALLAIFPDDLRTKCTCGVEYEIDWNQGRPKAKYALDVSVSGKVAPTINWFQVRFDDEKVYMAAQPADREPWTQDFRWADIKQICFKAENIYMSDGIYVFTKIRPESYVVPTEAIGAQELWSELIRRGLFDAELATTAATAIEGQFWWPPNKSD
jgi:TPR repeat protein